MATGVMEQSKTTGVPWWLVLIEAIALLILGILFIAEPRMTTTIVVYLLGLYWLVAGILRIVMIFQDKAMWGWKLFAGMLGILAGIIVIRHPLWSPFIVTSALVIIFGIVGVIMGVIGIVQAFKGAGWGAGIIGVVSILIGLVLLANVWIFTLTLPWVLGILSIVGGIIAVYAAFKLK